MDKGSEITNNEPRLKIGRSLNMLAGNNLVSYMETTLHEHDKEKWLVFGNLEIRITSRVKRDFRTLRGTLTSKKSVVDIVRRIREND